MGSEFLNELVDAENRVDKKEWEDALMQYLEEREIEVPTKGGLRPTVAGVPSFSDYRPKCGFAMGQTVNCHRYLPYDSITRIKSTTDFQSTLSEIVDETYDNIDSRMDDDLGSEDGIMPYPDGPVSNYEQGVKSHICERIASWFKGMVDFEKMTSGEEQPESDMETPNGGCRVRVCVQNSRNLQDTAVYWIDDARDFFGDSFGDHNCMFKDMWESDIEPEHLVRNVAFDFKGPSWHSSSPRKSPCLRLT